jgi:ABC-type multidrug transport system fused ATPase/permease subunit
MTFLFLAVQAGNYLSKFAQEILSLQQAEGSARRVLELLDEPPEPSDPDEATDIEEVKGQLVFENVTFAYQEGQPVLDGFSLTVEPGEHLAIVGPSGAGKTTVANLAARLYDPDGGRILIDGRDLKLVRRASYRRHVALVPQDTVLFAATVRENIAFGRPEASLEEVVDAAKAAGAHEFIAELPAGYETELTDLGQNLSGGQRQRIAIARALLRRPSILILDEATSALDRESEAAVQEALATLMAGRTAIIIAHRLSTIKHAYRIVVLLDGKVVEEGTHDQLLLARGVYYRLYHAQAEAEAARVDNPKGYI